MLTKPCTVGYFVGLNSEPPNECLYKDGVQVCGNCRWFNRKYLLTKEAIELVTQQRKKIPYGEEHKRELADVILNVLESYMKEIW